MSHLSDSTALHCRYDKSATGATRMTRVQGRRHSGDWGGHVHLTFSRSCSWDWRKIQRLKTKLVHARIIIIIIIIRNLYSAIMPLGGYRELLFLRRPPCWYKHGSTRTTSATPSARHARHVTSGHDLGKKPRSSLFSGYTHAETDMRPTFLARPPPPPQFFLRIRPDPTRCGTNFQLTEVCN